jgi:hypothetical protein
MIKSYIYKKIISYGFIIFYCTTMQASFDQSSLASSKPKTLLRRVTLLNLTNGLIKIEGMQLECRRPNPCRSQILINEKTLAHKQDIEENVEINIEKFSSDAKTITFTATKDKRTASIKYSIEELKELSSIPTLNFLFYNDKRGFIRASYSSETINEIFILYKAIQDKHCLHLRSIPYLEHFPPGLLPLVVDYLTPKVLMIKQENE